MEGSAWMLLTASSVIAHQVIQVMLEGVVVPGFGASWLTNARLEGRIPVLGSSGC